MDKTNIASFSDLEGIFSNVVTYLLGIAGIVLFILLIISGFKFVTSGGDPKALEGAKKTLTSAIAGLLIILLSYIVLLLISKITGVDLTVFRVVIPS